MHITPNTISINGDKNETNQAGSNYKKNVKYYARSETDGSIYQKIIIVLLLLMVLFGIVVIIFLIINMMNIYSLQRAIQDIYNKINYT